MHMLERKWLQPGVFTLYPAASRFPLSAKSRERPSMNE